ncbi:MAG: tryptophan 2,3-dioxygenase [Myxococcales bacterium]
MSEPTGNDRLPIPDEPAVRERADLTYNDYLKVPELLALQRPVSEPAHHDEMLFIVIHQSYELWFKLILHELGSAMGFMRQGAVLRARHFVARVVEILRNLVPQIHILETMTPAEFLQFRHRLMPASGFQSVQFREVEFAAGLKDERYLRFFRNRPDELRRLEQRLADPDLRTCFYDMLRDLGHPIPEDAVARCDAGDEEARGMVLDVLRGIWSDPEKDLPLYLLGESLIELDEYLSLWREHHVQVVERIIGHKRGTGGSSGVGYLRQTTQKKCFPLLWEVRTLLEPRT